MGQQSEIIEHYRDIFSLSEKKEIIEYLKSAHWQYGHISNPKYPNNKFWTMNLKSSEFFNTYIFNKLQNILSKKFLLLDVYFNGQTYGQSGAWHIDSDCVKDYTFLYYANPEWHVSWGGETVFKLPSNQIQYILPSPNSAIFFPATVWHYARETSKDFHDIRTTLAFKLREIE